MQQFDLYPQAWAVYITLGLALLFMLDLKLRHTGFKRRVGILILIAVGAFTPHTVSNADSLAPLILTMLFDAEINGLSAIIQGLATLLIIWGIAYSSVLALRHLISAKTKNTVEKESIKNID